MLIQFISIVSWYILPQINNFFSLFKVPPKIAPFSFGDAPHEAGESVSTQCSVSSGDLPINISWWFNGQPISLLSDITTSSVSHRSSFLEIESLKGFHVGNYTCMGINKAGNMTHTAQLLVNGAPPATIAWDGFFPKALPNFLSLCTLK